jgi:hypothetical protein
LGIPSHRINETRGDLDVSHDVLKTTSPMATFHYLDLIPHPAHPKPIVAATFACGSSTRSRKFDSMEVLSYLIQPQAVQASGILQYEQNQLQMPEHDAVSQTQIPQRVLVLGEEVHDFHVAHLPYTKGQNFEMGNSQ